MEELKSEAVLFVGTYTNNGSEGIYRFNLNLETGQLSNQSLAASIKNPSFLTFSPDKKTLYAVGEVDDFIEGSGSITTFRVKDNVLTEIDTKSTYGANPCYVGVDKEGDFVAVANYSGGNIAIYKTMDNGDLVPSPQVIDHKVLDTRKTAHAHMSKFLNGELFVSDLGLDRIKKYSQTNGKFSPSQQKELVVTEGAGPRHFVASKEGKFLYAINELNSTITLYNREGEKYFGLETYDAVAGDFNEESFCGDIHLSPDGKFLYGSNRGENTIVIFKVDEASGKLELIGRESVKGDWPRNFSIDPSGNFLLVANQRSNNIVAFKRDNERGTLSFISEVELPSPVCLQFY
ncbi:lactonase family protein [Maribacter sp. ACAM166]|uniref:lactonase family protein n=1 Tax=Maribacter sp. ACAM166 TaxID=2508996 RepID=UPI0014854924|nr:lactonase family protein [Maribacter sp. ACAM166]